MKLAATCRAQVQMVRDIQKASRNLCHRQLSWFRDEQLFRWVDAERELSEVVDEIVAELSSDSHTGILASAQPCALRILLT